MAPLDQRWGGVRGRFRVLPAVFTPVTIAIPPSGVRDGVLEWMRGIEPASHDPGVWSKMSGEVTIAHEHRPPVLGGYAGRVWSRVFDGGAVTTILI
jgi:hypothetical protein